MSPLILKYSKDLIIYESLTLLNHLHFLQTMLQLLILPHLLNHQVLIDRPRVLPQPTLFGTETQALTREKAKEKNDTQFAIDDTLYELPEDTVLEWGDGLIGNSRVEAEDLFQPENITKQEEEDLMLQQIKQEYSFEDIKESLDEEKIPENIYFFYGGESDNFYRAVEFMGPDANNREFTAFLISDIGRQVMTSNTLSMHLEIGQIFYEYHNTGENFYNFLVAQQNEEAAFIPKTFAYWNTFEMYISQFLQAFSLDDIEKYDLFAHKNSKYLFYCFNEYVKAYGGSRKKIRHTRKYENSISMQK